jgi:dTDP-4-amino-4,6-dideoxygalactose transaminase
MPPYVASRTDGDLPVTADLSSRGLNLPTSPEMTTAEITRVVDAVRVGLA